MVLVQPLNTGSRHVVIKNKELCRRVNIYTMQDEHPEIVIGDPLAPRSLLSVGRNTPTGAPAFSSVW